MSEEKSGDPLKHKYRKHPKISGSIARELQSFGVPAVCVHGYHRCCGDYPVTEALVRQSLVALKTAEYASRCAREGVEVRPDSLAALDAAWVPPTSAPHQEEQEDGMHARSGGVSGGGALVGFLYILMRDVVPPGRVENIMEEHIETSQSGGRNVYTNGWLARHAMDLAERLKGE